MIAVLAGTPVDTAMGVAYLKKNGLASRGYHVSDTPKEQSLLQVVYPLKLVQMVKEILMGIREEGMDTVYVYCNSIAAAVDLESLASELSLQIITPLMIYVEMGRRSTCLGVLAANNQSTHGIERSIQKHNEDVHVIGTGMLKLVDAVEEGLSPEEIIHKFRLVDLLKFYGNAGCEAVILGCTHFSYFYEALSERSPLPLVDPAESMLLKIAKKS
ncbi:aspartate/glutamate racemase family protein [Proteiniclasticum sp. SCR006]|uniref:Aspartate/glutamate racemase family protein n=1 Tax=Proteiniclasticum aestuarii TaxID=2817862 RepID=A0A939KI54_9CLOT|nr:aspartate/glutamate racemase family protein [Proteiniclasticum aestuarii]MBO1266279.1 aspartate/glutamate racemase family protein [Proteiniclasticum aestuarii]